jgi:uracil-DNA glycosylase family 4
MPADHKGTIVPDRNDAPVLTDYDPACRRCPRLASFLAAVKREYPAYWCKPVPPFGERGARLVVVGLAPGMHGANASGRPFTGDYAGILLYATLHAYGFATQPTGTARDDGLRLIDCRITNAVKCLPPENKPAPMEVRTCNDYLRVDLASVPEGGAILALGRIAHDATLRALALKAPSFAFAHGATHALHGRRVLVDSYHCSRYNTNTRRLTPEMFHAAFDTVVAHLARSAKAAA